jgi:hypothetical protein
MFSAEERSVEMQTASHRHRNGCPASHGQVKKGSQAPPCQLLMLPAAEAIEGCGEE